MSDENKSGAFEGYAIVEVLGHRRFAGMVKQVSMGTAAMFHAGTSVSVSAYPLPVHFPLGNVPRKRGGFC